MKAPAEPGRGRGPAQLVRRILDGDRQAEAELVELHSRGLSYMLRHLSRDPSLSEDLHQETFRIVLQRVRKGELREPEKLGGFIRGTARNLLTAELRKRSRRFETEEIEETEAAREPLDPASSQLSQVLVEEDRHRVRRLLGEMRSERDRQILYRFYIVEEDREEICRSLELTRQQFNLVLFRAHGRFRDLVERSDKRLHLGEVQAAASAASGPAAPDVQGTSRTGQARSKGTSGGQVPLPPLGEGFTETGDPD